MPERTVPGEPETPRDAEESPSVEAVRIGIAVYTYDGTVSFGITGDEPTTEDLDVLAAGIEDGMLELVRAAAVHSRTGRAG